MNKLIGMLAFIFFQVPAMAEQLYVKQDGFGDICLVQQPCGNIQTAIDRAEAGDIVLIGPGIYRENLFIQTAGITLQGINKRRTIITTAGGREGATGNAGNPLDAIIEVRAANVSIYDVSLIHPKGNATKREAAIFAWKGSPNLHVKDSIIERRRIGRTDEPTTPGSRGIFIFSGPASLIEDNLFRGNYQDHIHLPSNAVTVRNNRINGASRAGISVMDPVSFVGPDVFDTTNNLIEYNIIKNSLNAGIHIQGDQTTIKSNILLHNGGYGIYLCGEGLGGGCYFPGEEAISEENIIMDNVFKKNKQGTVADFGLRNKID